MRLVTRFSTAIVLLLAGGALFGAPFGFRQEWTKEVSLAEGGVVWISNPTGNIDIIGVDGSAAPTRAAAGAAGGVRRRGGWRGRRSRRRSTSPATSTTARFARSCRWCTAS